MEISKIPFLDISKEELVVRLAPLAVSAFAIPNYLETLRNGDSNIPWILTAGVLGFLGNIADTASTISVFNMANRADAIGIEHNLVEANQFLPDRPTPQDLLGGKTLVQDCFFVVFGIVCPPLGIATATGKIAAAMCNKHTERWLEAQIVESNNLL
jgi:hypothetical protein